jgi:hypothetical protein
MSDALSPIVLPTVLDDPDLVQRLVEANGPYYPVQRYFENQAQYRANTGHARMLIAPNFRGDWAYDSPQIDGVEPLLFHEGFRDAAQQIFSAEVVRPQQVYANLTWQLPFAQGPGHTDVPAFRGIDRTEFPTQLLSIMGHARLFERYRVRIATAVAWFYRGKDGGFEYWPEGPDGPRKIHEGEIFNTAIVGDNDFMYHRVRPVGRREDGIPGPMTLETRLERIDGEQWQLVERDQVLGTPCYRDLRISVSWKANVFADAAEADLYDAHTDDLSIDAVWETFFRDLAARGEAFDEPGDPLHDEPLTELLGRVYLRAPELRRETA